MRYFLLLACLAIGMSCTAGQPEPRQASYQYPLSWPTKGRITSGYGQRWGRYHNGIDLSVAQDIAVYAAAAGTVFEVLKVSGFGLVVIIDHHTGLKTLYGHNISVLVKKGVSVRAGQKIAISGHETRKQGKHLHFEVWDKRHPEKPQNPLRYLPPR